MKFAKKLGVLLMVMLLSMALLVGCGGNDEPAETPAPDQPQQEQQEQQEQPAEDQTAAAERTTFNLAAMKGPTAMGMVKMIEDSANGETKHDYQATIYGAADEIVPLLVQGKVDVAAVPCNLASVLNTKTEGAITIAAVNTLGVLYILDTDGSVNSIEDLKGKTIYSTGKGTTPEYSLNYILTQNGIDPTKDVTVEFKSEATEVAALLTADGAENVVAVLPQPYVTTVLAQNDKVRIALNMTEEWEKVGNGTTMLTGCIVARKAFVEENKAAFDEFLEEYKASTEYAISNVSETAALIEKYGIIKAAVAEKALPACNITFIAGEEMKTQVGAYLKVLFEQNPQAVGGKLPDEDFYYTK